MTVPLIAALAMEAYLFRQHSRARFQEEMVALKASADQAQASGEIREESGFEVRVTNLLALLDRNRHGHPPHVHHIYKVFLPCAITGGSPTTRREASRSW